VQPPEFGMKVSRVSGTPLFPLAKSILRPGQTEIAGARPDGDAAAAEAPAPTAEAAPKAEKPAAAEDHVKGMPSGYEEMTVAQISEGAKTWNRPMLEAALEYEQAHAARKGALAALQSALKSKEGDA